MARRRPSPAAPPEGVVIPLPERGLGSLAYWGEEIEAAETRIKEEIPHWQADLRRYGGAKPKLWGVRPDETITVNAQFYTVEQKKPQLFFQTPFVQVTSERAETAAAAPIVQAVLNTYLGRTEIHAAALVEEVLNDCLISAGVGPTKLGYDCVRVPVQVPSGRVDPRTGQPVLDPRTGAPETVTTQKTIFSRYYWKRISPADLLIPAGFTSSRYEEAPWLGFRFPLNPETLPDREATRAAELGATGASMTLVPEADRRYLQRASYGREVWYRASLYDPAVVNPEVIRQLVIVPGAGARQPVVLVHRDSPYQRFDPMTGAFLQGMRGFPIHPCVIRPLPDSAYPQSDCRVIREVADEKSLGRSQMVQQRRRNLPLRGFNKNVVRKQDLEKIERGEVQSLIGFDVDPREALVEIAQAAFPRENFAFNDITQQDLDRLAASGANQQGLPNQDADTATEASLIQRATDTRLAKERERVLDWFLGGVEKLFALLQLYADHPQTVAVVGEDGARRLETWDKTTIQGRFGFSLKPDSSIRTDAAIERDRYLRLFNLIANHPQANGAALLKILVEKWDLDPSALVNPEPPPPPAEKPKVSISIKGDDLNPLAPQYANIVTLLQLAGVSHLAAPGADGGVTPSSPLNPVNKHDAALTGRPSGPPVAPPAGPM